MRRHGLRIFQRATCLEVGSNAGRAENVAAELTLQASLRRAPPDHVIGIHSMHRPIRKNPGSACGRAEEGGLTVLAHPRGSEILIEELLEFMMRRHFVALAAFLVHPHLLRHGCGFKLVNQGIDTRSLAAYLGHRNMQNTVRYTKMSAKRFEGFWRD